MNRRAITIAASLTLTFAGCERTKEEPKRVVEQPTAGRVARANSLFSEVQREGASTREAWILLSDSRLHRARDKAAAETYDSHVIAFCDHLSRLGARIDAVKNAPADVVDPQRVVEPAVGYRAWIDSASTIGVCAAR